jgi:hypothetical protein
MNFAPFNGLTQTVAAVLIVLAASTLSSARAPETPHLQFVQEYLRELAQTERLRQRAVDDLKGSGNTMADCVRNMTSLKLELGAQVGMMRSMTLNKPFDELPGAIAAYDLEKIDAYKQFADGCSAMIAGPQPGVNYGHLAGEVPKLTARLDYIDHAILEASPMIFATLIDDRADSQGHVSHLIITTAERTALLDQIAADFGGKVDQTDSGYLVTSAAIVKGYLLKDFKGANEPW